MTKSCAGRSDCSSLEIMVAEAVLSSTLTLIAELLAPHVLNYLGPLWGVDEDLRRLNRALLAVQTVVGDAEERQLKDKAVRSWFSELKHAAYDAEDLLDGFNTELLRRKAKSQGRMIREVSDFFSPHNQIVFRLQIGSKVKSIMKRIDEIVAEMHKFNFKVDAQPQGSSSRLQSHSFVVESEVIGRQEDREKLVNLLIDHHFEEKVAMISLVGMGGLGKTTLAQFLYSDLRVQNHFQLRAWVCVSDDFDAARLARLILQSATGEECGLGNMELLQQRLRETLNAKRYLLVLDDVWNEDALKWDELRGLLLCGSEGSRIIVTTRNEKCSIVMEAQILYRLQPLSEDDSWALFERRAFAGDIGQQNENLVRIGRSIVRRCGGLPLAVKALASLLRLKSEEKEWQAVMESEIWDLQDGEDGILPALKLSFSNLPSHLKQCFAFCAVFPKDHEFDKQMLIELWMANGFIPSQGTADLEVKGNEIFKELVWRSFLQDVHVLKVRCKSIFCGSWPQDIKFGFLNFTTCKMHDLMHDLAQFVMRDECFQVTRSLEIPRGVRHLPLTAKSYVPNASTPPTMRSILNPYSLGISMAQKQKFVRALNLEGMSFRIGRMEITWIGHLQHLRYLDLTGNFMEKLPNSISLLFNLQTLKLNGCSNLCELPKGVTLLSSLRHLYLIDCENLKDMPAGMSQLSCLKTLTKYIIGSRDGNSLRELKHLNLGGELELQGLRNVINVGDAREADMHSKRDLDSLSFCWAPPGLLPHGPFNEGSELEVKNAEEVLEALKPHCGVKRLVIRDYSGLHFPLWMSDSQQLQNLVELHLRNCSRCEQLPALEMLPFLEVLIISEMNAVKHFTKETSAEGLAFPSLKRLELTVMQNLERWCIPEEREATLCFPSLIVCSIDDCTNLKTLPLIPNVKELVLTRFNPTSDHGFSVKEGFFKHLRFLEKLNIQGCDELILLLQNEEETRGMSPSFREMRISNCNRLSAEHVWSLPSVERLDVNSCDTLVSWPQETLTGFNSMKSLEISDCKNLVKVTGLPSLEGLCVDWCAALAELSEFPASLKTLSIWDCPNLKSLNDEPGCLTNLQNLSLSGCPSLETLPREMGCLISLERLHIHSCPKLTSFPRSLQQQLPHLSSLQIKECPELEKQYQPGGPFCHLVSQIPHVEIGIRQPRSKRGLKLAISPLLSSCH